MKVWLLRAPFDNSVIVGVFTSAGKKSYEKVLLAEAIERRDIHIETLREEIEAFQKQKDNYTSIATSLRLAGVSGRKFDIEYSTALELAKQEQRYIDFTYDKIHHITHMDNDELLREYCYKWHWEEHELEGD